MTTALVVLACAFAVISGVNDGGVLVGTGLKLSSVPPVTAVFALMLSVAAIPMVTAQVATTFTTRLTVLSGPPGRLAMAVAVLAALAVVTALSLRGRPTSLTLAVVGGVTGAALGLGLPVSPGAVLLVLAVGFAAPFAGALAAALASRLLVRLATGADLPGWHSAGFALQCLAYAANDGQKMLAVFLVALGLTEATPLTCLLIGVLFGLGTLYGLPRAGRTLGREIVASRPLHAVSAELASGVTVIGCAAAGAPVSMTQAIAGGLIGAGSPRRVRWHAASKIVVAWMLTLPMSGLLSGVAALLVKEVAG